MIFESDEKIGLKDIGKNNKIKNESILEILENVAGRHSDKVGFGVLDIERTKASWILLEWKVKVLKRPTYGENLKIQTWGRYFQKAYTYRDFKILNEQNEICVIATSKWALINIETHGILRLTEEIRNLYKPEEVTVFEEETLPKLNIPENFSNTIEYTVGRKDIDLNNHMHNTYYLNLAYEALPTDVYENRPYDNFRITYKKEICVNDKITCSYSFENDKHIIVIKTKEKNITNAIIELSK